jgi:hypothetical protein
VFAEYLEMHEYNNILTRMLGADSFPYRNITVTDEVRDALRDEAVFAGSDLFLVWCGVVWCGVVWCE